MKSARLLAYELLLKMENGAFSNIVLDSGLSDCGLSQRDKGFVSRVFYGVIERRLTLDYIISLYSTKPLKSIDTQLLIILRTGVYQLLFMDSVPDNAAVNESVSLCRIIKKTSAAGFVNAVLRSFIRSGKKYELPSGRIQRLCINYSCNEQLVRMLIDDYSYETAEKFLSASLESRTLYIRVNNTRISADNLAEKFRESGINAVKHDKMENCLVLDKLNDIDNNPLFLNGFFHVQDLSSQLCCAALNPQENDRVLDICSAPGGKAFTLAGMMNGKGTVTACDLHDKRAGLISQGASRLGFGNIKVLQNDARNYNGSLGSFDKILCDVPCSGYGVIRSKPEIKYTLPEDASMLPQLQYKILKMSAGYLKTGGEIVYSTCTVLKRENDEVVERFLTENPGFEGAGFIDESDTLSGDYKVTIFPEYFNSDGFFICKIRKIV